MAGSIFNKVKNAYNNMARSGSFGDDVRTYKQQDDLSSQSPASRPPVSGNIIPYHDHLDNPDRLNQIADQSHQAHKSVTGQVPNVDPEDQGYTTYQHQGSYYQPGEDE